MSFFIFRNATIEPFFQGTEFAFSQYYDINYLPEDVNHYIWFYQVPFNAEHNSLSEEINQYFNNLLFVLERVQKDKTFLVFSLNDYLNFTYSSGDFQLKKAIDHFNKRILDLADSQSNVKVIDFRNFTDNYGRDELIDWKYYYNAQIYLNLKLIKPFKVWFQRQLDAINFKRKKCIIVDLDNTMWGGVLGEEGLHGIQIGNDYPGAAFLHFQKTIIELVNHGIILAICSKNNEEDILEVWEKNPFNLVNSKHVSAHRINWNNKADNIKEIIQELNIGADSVVFIDDNPTEREIVKHYLPEVAVPEFPKHPYLLPDFSKYIIESYFRNYNVTEEDQKKTEQYKLRSARAKAQESFSDISEYLRSLDIEIQIQTLNDFNIERISQMTQKTNQFNLTTHRYDVPTIRSMHESGSLIYTASVKDKFGDNGITGLMIVNTNKQNATAQIDTYLLSCRILGKGIEDAFFQFIINNLYALGYKEVEASFIPTSKNAQVSNFCERQGFEVVKQNETGAKYYSKKLNDTNYEINPLYKINLINHA